MQGAPGPEGKQGVAGQVGTPGRDGRDWQDGKNGLDGRGVDPKLLAGAVVRVHFLGRNGKRVRTVEVPLGGDLDIPPIMLSLYDDANGDKIMSPDEIFQLVEPLGQPLKIEVKGGLKVR